MEGNNMADNNQLMEALIERLKGLQSSALNSYNSSKEKNEFLAYEGVRKGYPHIFSANV